MLALIALIVSFVVLYYGANWLVSGAKTIALSLSVSRIAVGLTLVAFGTSAPELFVNLIAARKGFTHLALANIAGSNLANFCIGFGLCAFAGSLVVHKKFKSDLIFAAIAPILIIVPLLLFDGTVPKIAVTAYITVLIFYIYSVKRRVKETEEFEEKEELNLFKGILVFIAGCASLYGGGEMVLYGAVEIARYLHISETIIGLTIVAIGTSIPDIMASIIAIRQKETSIAVGNLLGSNIFNVLLVLSGTLLVSTSEIRADFETLIDFIMVFAVTIIFATFAFIRPQIGKAKGLFLIFVYILFLIVRVFVTLS